MTTKCQRPQLHAYGKCTIQYPVGLPDSPQSAQSLALSTALIMERKRGYSIGPGRQEVPIGGNQGQKTEPNSHPAARHHHSTPVNTTGNMSMAAAASGAVAAAAPSHLQDFRGMGTNCEYDGGRYSAQQGLGRGTSWGTALLPAPGAMVRSTTDRVHDTKTYALLPIPVCYVSFIDCLAII